MHEQSPGKVLLPTLIGVPIESILDIRHLLATREKIMATNRYVVEVFCTGMGFVRSRHGSDFLDAAKLEEKALHANAGAWVNPSAPKQTRIFDTKANALAH